jgi:hypothetical protein
VAAALTTETFMHRSVASRKIAALIASLGINAHRAGVALLLYSGVLLAASLLLATSWSPSAIVVGAVVVCAVHAGAGLALIRRSVWRRVIVVTSGGLHVVLTVAWIVLLVAA